MRIRTSVQSDGQEELKQGETKPLASGLRRSSRLSNAPSDTTNDTSNSSGSGKASVKKKGKGNGDGHPHHSKRSHSSVSEVSGPKSSPSKRRKSVQPIKWAESGEDRHYAVKVPVKLEKDNKSSWDGEEDFDVESVLEKLVRRGHADEYLVKWLGWSFNQTTWLKREALDKTGERLSECRERFRVLTAASENAPKGFKLLPEKIDPREAILPPGLQATYALELELKKHFEKTGAAPLYIMNWVDDEGPPSFVYIDKMMHSTKVCSELSKMYRLIKCDCSSGYCGGSQCLCTTLGNTTFKEGATTLQGVNWISNSGGLSECSSACDCTNCKNKKTQAPRKVKLILTKSKEKGWCLLAGEKIPVGTFVTRYNGKVLTHEEADAKKEKENDAYEFQMAFVLDSALAGSGDEDESDTLRKELQKNVMKNFVPGDGHGLGHSTPSRLMWNGGNPQGLVIDAGVYGNESRFINHSCDPNLAVVRIMDQGIGFGYHAIGFFALEDIQVGEELTFDYGLAHEKGRAKCRCGKAVCRGALFPQRHLPGQPQSRNSRQSTSKK